MFGTTLRNSANGYLKYIYSGGLQANADLNQAFDDGLWVYDPSASLSTQDVADILVEAATVKLIQVAWSLENSQYPAVLYDKPGVKNPLNLPTSGPNNQYFSDDDAAKTRYPGEVDGKDGNKYSAWIVNVNNPPPRCNTRECANPDRPIVALKGMDAIKDAGNSWGITWMDMIASSLQGFLLAKKTNPFGLPDVTKTATGDFGSGDFIALQGGPATPGFVNIPTCTGRLALENYSHLQELRLRQGNDKKPEDICASWPCCKVTWDIAQGSSCVGLNDLCE